MTDKKSAEAPQEVTLQHPTKAGVHEVTASPMRILELQTWGWKEVKPKTKTERKPSTAASRKPSTAASRASSKHAETEKAGSDKAPAQN